MANAENLHERYEPDLMRLFTADSTIRLNRVLCRLGGECDAIILNVQP